MDAPQQLSVFQEKTVGMLRSDFVQEIQRFAARPQHNNTQNEDQKSGHFLIPPLSRSWLCSCFSVDEFRVELTNAVASVFVFAEFGLGYDAEGFLFQGIQL